MSPLRPENQGPISSLRSRVSRKGVLFHNPGFLSSRPSARSGARNSINGPQALDMWCRQDPPAVNVIFFPLVGAGPGPRVRSPKETMGPEARPGPKTRGPPPPSRSSQEGRQNPGRAYFSSRPGSHYGPETTGPGGPVGCWSSSSLLLDLSIFGFASQSQEQEAAAGGSRLGAGEEMGGEMALAAGFPSLCSSSW